MDNFLIFYWRFLWKYFQYFSYLFFRCQDINGEMQEILAKQKWFNLANTFGILITISKTRFLVEKMWNRI